MRHTGAVFAVLCATIVNAQETRRPRSGWVRMSATAYCNQGETRSGEPAQEGAVAADPRVIPVGSTIAVQGLRGARDGTYVVLDTGRAIKGREIDLFIGDCRAAKRFGRQTVRVRIVKRAPADRDEAPKGSAP